MLGEITRKNKCDTSNGEHEDVSKRKQINTSRQTHSESAIRKILLGDPLACYGPDHATYPLIISHDLEVWLLHV